jgi:hypothetical protein
MMIKRNYPLLFYVIDETCKTKNLFGRFSAERKAPEHLIEMLSKLRSKFVVH